MSEPRGHFTIELNGSFDVNWSDFFEDMQVYEHVEQDIVRSTTLIAQPRDMEAFLGILHTLVDWGFPVQAFEYRQVTSRESVVGDSLLNDSADATTGSPLGKQSR